MDLIFDKTDKGREEIATRRYEVPAKLRSLLLVIDGKQSAESILKKFSAVGVTEDAFKQLLANGFIQAVSAPEPVAAVASAATEIPPADAQSQYRSIYQFFNETIKSTLGLRGVGLQLKVERCTSVDDFRALRGAYLEAVSKSRGPEVARSLGDRLDKLLT